MTDRTELLDRYRQGPDVVEAALAGLTDADLDRRPDDGGWTARQVVHHLADSETMSATRIRRLLAEPHPVIHGYDEAEFARTLRYDRPLGASLNLVRAVRETTASLLDRLTEADWARTGTHTEGGAYGVLIWLEIYAAHCHDHADQIRRAVGRLDG